MEEKIKEIRDFYTKRITFIDSLTAELSDIALSDLTTAERHILDLCHNERVKLVSDKIKDVYKIMFSDDKA